MSGYQKQHQVTIAPVRQPKRAVVGVYFGPDTPQVQGGKGGWVVTPRDGRDPVTEWVSTSEASMELAVRLVREVAGDVTGAVERLEEFCTSPSPGVAPPLLRVSGLLRAANRVWAANDVQFSEVRRFASGNYETAVATISLVAADNTGDGVAVVGRVPLVYVTKKNDTLMKIAARFYRGNKKNVALNAKRIRDANKANKKLRKDIGAKQVSGLKLRMP